MKLLSIRMRIIRRFCVFRKYRHGGTAADIMNKDYVYYVLGLLGTKYTNKTFGDFESYDEATEFIRTKLENK